MTTKPISPLSALGAALTLTAALAAPAHAQAPAAATQSVAAGAAAPDTSDVPVPKVYGKRFGPLTPETMTPEQKTMARNMAHGPRGDLRGPASAYLRSPELGDALQQVGAMVRFKIAFPLGVRELAAAMASRYMNSPYEWAAHSVQSVDAGIGKDTIDAIGHNKRPKHMKPDEEAVYNFTDDLLQRHSVTDAHFKAVKDRWGDHGVMDLVGVVGYFVVVGMALNVDIHPAPPNANPLPGINVK